MNIFNQIKIANNLSNNEQLIADYILEHPEQVITMNASGLSKQCYVSTSTVYRLCEKLNLSGFSEMKLRISTDLDNYISSRDFDFNFPIKQYQTHYEIMNYLKEDYDKTITSTLSGIDLDELRLIISSMLKAKVIDVYTSAGNIYFAENFRFQMAEIGTLVRVPIDEYEQRLLAASSDDTHFAIVITFGGRGHNAKFVPEVLKRKKTPVLLMSSPDYHDDNCDYHLFISPHENHYKKISSYGTRLSILYLLDVLYTCYFERNYDDNIEKKISYYRHIGPNYL